MKLAIVRTSAIPLKTEFYNIQEIGLAKQLAGNGYLVDLIFGSTDSDHKEAALQNIGENIQAHYLRTIKLFNQHGYFISIFKTLKKLDPDLIQVHEYNVLLSVLVIFWARIYSKKVVIFQGLYTEPQGFASNIMNKFFDKSVLPIERKLVEGVLCKTSFAKAYMDSKSFNNVQIAHVGLDTDLLEFKEKETFDDTAKFNLLYIGNFETRRNPLFILELVKELRDKVPYINLTMIGQGELIEEMTEFISKHGLQDSVRLIPPVKQNKLANYYYSSDLFVLPSNYEIYGMVILEAMYFGLPVISTITAGSTEIIEHDIDGVLIDSLDINKWKNAVKSLSENKEHLSEMGKAAELKINEKFLWKNTSCDFTNFYVDVYQLKG